MTAQTITPAQFDRMVEGSMALGPFYVGDPSRESAEARVQQMLDRAGVRVEEESEEAAVRRIVAKYHDPAAAAFAINDFRNWLKATAARGGVS